MERIWSSVEKRKKQKAKLFVETICPQLTPYPTVVIPMGKDGSISHAVCVVDDLIFDSTQRSALKLTHKSFHWISGNLGTHDEVYGAMRFERPCEKGLQVFTCTIQNNW